MPLRVSRCLCVGPSKDPVITQFDAYRTTDKTSRRTIDEWHIINVDQATHGHMHLHHHIPLLRGWQMCWCVSAPIHQGGCRAKHRRCPIYAFRGSRAVIAISYMTVSSRGLGLGNACLLQVLFAQPTRNFAMTRNIKNEATHPLRAPSHCTQKHKPCAHSCVWMM